jgi:hypothetical protein
VAFFGLGKTYFWQRGIRRFEVPTTEIESQFTGLMSGPTPLSDCGQTSISEVNSTLSNSCTAHAFAIPESETPRDTSLSSIHTSEDWIDEMLRSYTSDCSGSLKQRKVFTPRERGRNFGRPPETNGVPTGGLSLTVLLSPALLTSVSESRIEPPMDDGVEIPEPRSPLVRDFAVHLRKAAERNSSISHKESDKCLNQSDDLIHYARA